MKFREYNSTVSSGGSNSSSFVLDAEGLWTRNNAETVDAKARTLLNRLRQVGRDLFLPVGYPRSVAEGYLEYQFYDSLQGLCTYLRGVVSTSAVLVAAGVGDAEATGKSLIVLIVLSLRSDTHNTLRFSNECCNDMGNTRRIWYDWRSIVQLHGITTL